MSAVIDKEHQRISRQEARYWRHEKLVDADGRCEVCHLFAPYILNSHHIIPVAEGGDSDWENLVILCPNCHALVHFFMKHDTDQVAADMEECLQSDERYTAEQLQELQQLAGRKTKQREVDRGDY